MNKLNKIINNLRQVKPSEQWQTSTLKVLQELEKNSVTNSKNLGTYNQPNLFFTNLLMKKPLILASIGIFSTVLLFSGGLLLLSTVQKSSRGNLLSDSEKLIAITNLLKNNQAIISLSTSNNFSNSRESDAAASTNQSPQTSNVAGNGLNAVASKLISDFPDTVNKLVYNKTKITNGIAACGFVDPLIDSPYSNFISENYNYFDSTQNNVSKSFVVLDNNVVTDFYYNKNTNSSYETYEYKGGKYAIKNAGTFEPLPLIQTDDTLLRSSVEPDIFPTQVIEEDPIDQFKRIYGDNAKIYNATAPNGKEAILVEYSYKTFCNQDPAASFITVEQPNFWNGEDYNQNQDPSVEQGDTTIINRTWMDISTNEIFLNESYKDTINTSNLLWSSETLENRISDESFESALAKVTLDLNGVSIKDYSIPNTSDSSSSSVEYDYAEQVDATISSLKEDNLPIIASASSDYYNSITYMMIEPEFIPEPYSGAEYLSDRDFYPTGEIGDKLFNFYSKDLSAVSKISTLPYYDTTTKASIYVTLNQTNNSKERFYSFEGKVVDSALDEISIINSMIYAPVAEKSISTVDLGFGESSANLYSYTSKEYYASTANIDEVGKTSYTEVDCQANPCLKKSFIIIANFGEYKFAFKIQAFDPVAGDLAETEMYRPTNTVDLEFSKDLLTKLNLKKFNLSSQEDVKVLKESMLRGYSDFKIAI